MVPKGHLPCSSIPLLLPFNPIHSSKSCGGSLCTTTGPLPVRCSQVFCPRAPQGCRVPASVLKSWSCGSPAFISTSTRSSCTAPSGSFHHLSFHNQLKRPGWRGDLVGETDRFVSSDFLALLSDPSFSPSVLFSPSPFPGYKRKLLLLGLASAVGKGDCFF